MAGAATSVDARQQNREPSPDAVSEENLHPDAEAQLSFTGLTFSPDGTRIYLANVRGNIKVFSVLHGKVKPSFTIPLPTAEHRTSQV